MRAQYQMKVSRLFEFFYCINRVQNTHFIIHRGFLFYRVIKAQNSSDVACIQLEETTQNRRFIKKTKNILFFSEIMKFPVI